MILLFGKITGIHGIKGEIEVSFKDDIYFSSLPLLKSDNILYISSSKNPYKITDIKKKKLTLVFKLENIDSIDKAKNLMGNDVYIDTDEIKEDCNNNSFYIGSIIGSNIEYNNKIVGIVVDCYITKANTVLDIKLNDNTTVSIPFVSAYFGNVSIENNKIELINIDILKSV